MSKSWYRLHGKRWLDHIIAINCIVILSPVMLLVPLAVLLNLGKPIVFQQQRPGPNGKPFTLYKFRTMLDKYDVDGNLLPDKDRLTPFGQFLRSTSLDELPELFNVLKGDMSIVGPRPLLIEYLEHYTPEQARRHEVRPGITGWAQINGRNAISWEERFQMDVWYVDHVSLWLDLKIILLTFWKVIRREGINQEDHVTMSKFRGTE